MSTTQIPTIDMKVRRFAMQIQYSMIALVLMSVFPLRARAQDSHSHKTTQDQKRKGANLSKWSANRPSASKTWERLRESIIPLCSAA